MRILLLLGLLTYWLTHPAAVQVLVHLAEATVQALAHAHGAHLGAHSARGLVDVVALSGSHWN